ncbi:MAG TPA: ABC transporter ATP-binding protein [Nitrososphaerales archaeon]|nr:ABC transporter ATP-binding protein [Nitrososphaerales archaeon]
MLDVLDHVNFNIQKGEFVSIVGPSGCGKSTLLRIISGLERPSTGSVLIDGRPVSGTAQDRGFIFQAVGLYPWRNTIENVEFFLELKGVPREERRRIALEKLQLVGLADFASYPPVQLSGGMQQKVAIARALSTEPSLLLMDEPFGALDALSREKAQSDLLQILSKDMERSILFVTHSIDEAVYLSDKIIVFSPRPGKIRELIQVDLGTNRFERDIRSEQKFSAYCSEVRRHLISAE